MLAAFKAQLDDDNGNARRVAVSYFAQIGADDESTRSAIEARLNDDDGSVRRAAVEYFLKTGLGNQAANVFGAFLATPTFCFFAETSRRFAIAIGRLAADDEALLNRIIDARARHFPRSRAFAAIAGRRDEIRREQVSLAEVVGQSEAEALTIAKDEISKDELAEFREWKRRNATSSTGNGD